MVSAQAWPRSKMVMEDVTFEPATDADLAAIRALLRRCELPIDDVGPAPLEHFVVCRTGGRLAGTVGLELMGEVGLLRSLAVAPEVRRKGLGHALWARGCADAARAGVRHLYLLTTTASDLFARWGFQPVGREAVPPAIQATAEYSSLCPSTAVVMAMDLAAADSQLGGRSPAAR